MPQEHLKFLASGVNYVETENFIFLHAFFRISYRLDDKPASILRWEFLPDVRDKTPKHFSAKTVVCGHTTGKMSKITKEYHSLVFSAWICSSP